MPKRDGNKYSQASVVLGQLGPQETQQFGAQGQELFGSYAAQTRLLRLQRKQLGQQLHHQHQDILQQGQQDMWQAMGAANERGVLGSTSDATARLGIKSGMASQIIQARDAERQGLAANYGQLMGAKTDYRSGLIQLAAQKAAMKAVGASQKTLDKLLGYSRQGGDGKGNVRGDGSGGGGGTTHTGNPALDGWRQFDQQDVRNLSTKQQNQYSDKVQGMIQNRLQDKRQNLPDGKRIVWENGQYKVQTYINNKLVQGYQDTDILKRLTHLKRLMQYANSIGNPSVPKQAQ